MPAFADDADIHVLSAAAEPSDILGFYKSRVEAGEAERALFLERMREAAVAAAAASQRDAIALKAKDDEVRCSQQG